MGRVKIRLTFTFANSNGLKSTVFLFVFGLMLRTARELGCVYALECVVMQHEKTRSVVVFFWHVIVFFFFMTKKCFSIQIFTLQNRCGKSQMRNSFLVWTVPKLHCVRFYFWNLFYSSSKGNSAHTHTALLKRTLSWKKLTFYIWVLLSKPWTLLYCKNISIF